MAKKPVVQVLVDGAALEAAPVPSFAEAAKASTDATANRLAGLVDAANGAPGSAPAPEKTKTAEELYEEQYNALPEEFRTQFAQNVVTNHAQQLADHYGPEISGVLAEVEKDPELKKALGRMTEAKARDWIVKTAFPIYDDERFASPIGGDGEPLPNPQFDELTKTVTDLKKREADRDQQQYLEAMRTERVALENTFPELKWSDPASKEYKRVLAVVEETQERRAKGKPQTSMADVYSEYKDMWDFQAANPPHRAAPATSSATITGPQAPRNKFESRAGINAMLDKHGGIGSLAAALRK